MAPKKKKTMNLTWYRSYETLKFNTPDEDIDVGQYAVSESGRFIYRRDQKNNAHIKNEKTKEVIDLTEVTYDPSVRCYYHEFLMSDGRIYREKTTKEEYLKIAKENKIPAKTLTDQEVKKIQDDDKLWPHSITKVQIQDI